MVRDLLPDRRSPEASGLPVRTTGLLRKGREGAAPQAVQGAQRFDRDGSREPSGGPRRAREDVRVGGVALPEGSAVSWMSARHSNLPPIQT